MKFNFEKYTDGLVPAIVQDSSSGQVLMLGFMNAEALDATRESGMVTFFSRSKQRLWRKGETSGNYLELVSITQDCDSDTLLIKAIPNGPVCHTGAGTCFGESREWNLSSLEALIDERRRKSPPGSYVASLFGAGINRIAQKVGEESVETVIAAMDDDPEAFRNEAADLLFHYLVLLNAKGSNLRDVIAVLENRHRDWAEASTKLGR